MYFSSFFLLFFLFAHKLYATEVCIASTACKCVLNGGQVIDLSSVGLIERPRFSELVHNGSGTHFYSYNPCHPFDSPDKYTTVKDGNKPCINAAGCMKSPGTSSGNAPEEHAVGLQDTFKFDFIDGKAYINYTVPGAKQTLSVQLECDNSTEHELTVDEPESDESSHVVMTLKSKCACLNGCGSSVEPDKPSGLSTGSKLLIAFFTIMLAYFIIGMIYNFCNGAQGVELVPNLDFWNELPKLIIEGVAFSVSCCGKKSSYGEV